MSSHNQLTLHGWSTSTYSCRARYSEMALNTRQSPCADLVTSVRISPPARPDVSTIILVFSIYVHVFGFWLLGKYTLWLWLTCCCTVCRISAGIIDILYVYILYITTHIYSHVCCSDHSQNDNNGAASMYACMGAEERRTCKHTCNTTPIITSSTHGQLRLIGSQPHQCMLSVDQNNWFIVL